MKSTLMLLLLATLTSAGFMPNVRIDHQNLPNHRCCDPAIAVGPGAPSSQPLYVAFEDDSTVGMVRVRSDIMFQKSADAGRTWLPADLLIRRGSRYATSPDVTTDSDGNVHIVYVDYDTVNYGRHVRCVRSSDGGTTWTAPAQVDDNSSAAHIGWARIAADSAGSLFAAWNQFRGAYSHIFSSVSTDKGATWSPSVCVDDDTVPEDVSHADVFVQPGTNHYLVAATAPRWVEGHIRFCAYLYRSTDRGLTFQPGVQLDTFDYNTAHPHVVADQDHIICDYFGQGWNSRDRIIAESRTFYTQPDTWGTPSPITNLDTLHRLYYSGTLALSADGRVHTALMIVVRPQEHYLTYYASSSDHGVSWSDLELVNDDTTGDDYYPDIGADIAGHAYVVWTDASRDEIWFSTNNPAGIAESPTTQAPRIGLTVKPNVFRRTTTIRMSASSPVAHRSALTVCDASGRLVRTLAIRQSPSANHQFLSWNGCNNAGRRCTPGAYLIRAGSAVTKVILLPSE